MSASSSLDQTLPLYYRHLLTEFRKIVASSLSFHLGFGLLLAGEGLTLLLLLPTLASSAELAIALGALFLTLFCYLILHSYFSARKPEQFLLLKEEFVSSCRQASQDNPLQIAEALTRLSGYLQDFEKTLYPLPPRFQFLTSFFHKKEIAFFQNLLIQAAIDEHIQEIGRSPLDLEIHASLAELYKLQSAIHPHALKLALQELLILDELAPGDPWISEKIADTHQALGDLGSEVKQLESLVSLRPDSPELLERLSRLYFRQGENAKALKLYADLKRAGFPGIETLLSEYGRSSFS
jgi:hypothetical protein